MREQILAVLLALAAALIVIGVATFDDGAAFIIAGLLAGVWSWLVFGEVGDG